MKLTSSVDGGAGNAYKAQAGYGFDTPLEVGKTYELPYPSPSSEIAAFPLLQAPQGVIALLSKSPLKEYLSDPNFKLGIGVGMDEYLGDETTTTIVNENFNDLTIGYAMKHGPMVDSKGNLKFDKVDQLFTKIFIHPHSDTQLKVGIG